ncbi:unnamed protein product, partial [Brassica oleracea var. botrytis]
MFESPSTVSFQCSHFLPETCILFLRGREETQLCSKKYISFCSNTHGVGFLQQYLRNINMFVYINVCSTDFSNFRLVLINTCIRRHGLPY